MLKFYHTPLSVNSRRVWVMLLEKQVEFEEIVLSLQGDQFDPEYLTLNPFHHIPTLVDDDFTVIESLAILDYLEAKYPTPSFTPKNAKQIGTMRMVEFVTVNELLPTSLPLLKQVVGLPEDPNQPLEKIHQKITTIFDFYQKYLGENPYLVSEEMTLADIVVGTVIPTLKYMNVSLENHPQLQAWCERLMLRESWQKTEPQPEDIQASYARIKAILTQKSQ
ncbi:glutathione S-transferase family protein [Lyngbya sp. PCC 8106]|uniref:glutathione S-transferase family protein n=1 Tax=Lyngbya sp. (strain PCC 8106) TaxID=313612 RepID=UPI0000EACB05|nr:glutathione S-transferase family protein [Lyngbya sp. PCC 8106]EAW34163.1 Glutathione S-transferase-like protein [Lyngbya sp. PCC 8106]